MDPPLITESAYSAASLSAYSISEVWPLVGGQNCSSGGLSYVRGRTTGVSRLRDGSADASTVTVAENIGGKKRKEPIPGTERKDYESSHKCYANDSNISNKSAKVGRLQNDIHTFKSSLVTISAASRCNQVDQSSRTSEPPKGYIHVRARRGQATDSHSLAERARREKISERMKILQEIVPGCNKVIGKALVLDEIINYIQSLQHQVEFLSMKLEAVNSRMNMNPGMTGFSSKDPFDVGGTTFAQQSAQEDISVPEPEWLHMQIGTNYEQLK